MGQENRIETAHAGSVAVVTLVGEHDLATKPALDEVLGAVARPGVSVVIDVSPATFIDLTVVGAVEYAAENADAVAVVAADDAPCRRLLELIGLAAKTSIFPSQDDALRSLLAQAAVREGRAAVVEVALIGSGVGLGARRRGGT